MSSSALDLDSAWPEADPLQLEADIDARIEATKARESTPPEPASGVRARPVPKKPPFPIQVVAKRYLLARQELEARLDSGERVAVEIDGERLEVVMVADAVSASGEVVRRGGVRVERAKEKR